MNFNHISLKYLLFLTLIFIGFNQHLFNANWRWDDSQILLHAYNTSIFDNFTNPEIWRKFSSNNLTPWLILSFKIDYLIFGLNPLGFYCHHLLSLVFLSYLMIHLSNELTNHFKSGFLCFILFISGAPLYAVTEQLMTRHYIEGMIFCLLSIIFSIKFTNTKENKFIVYSLFFYVIATLCKEIYVPLIVILILIYWNNKTLNYKIFLSHFTVGLAYTAWRLYMLPSAIGGYSTGNPSNGIDFEKYFSGYLKIPELIFGEFWQIPSFAILLLSIIYLFKKPSRIIFISVTLISLLLPLAPLMNHPGINYPDRYLFAFWVFASLFITVSIFNFLVFFKKNIGKIIFMIFCLLTLPLSAKQSHKFRADTILIGQEFDAHAKFIIENKSMVNLFPSKTVLDSGWFIAGLFDLKSNILKSENNIKIIIDGFFINDIKDQFWIYSLECQCIEDKSFDLVNIKKRFESSLRPDEPLFINLKISKAPDRVDWYFGPYSVGSYEILLPESYGVIKFRRQGSLNIQIDPHKDMNIILKYTHPTGWSTYSPLLKAGTVTPNLNWKR